MSSFDIFGFTVPAWAGSVSVVTAVLVGLRWCVILVAYILHLVKRKPGEVFEVEIGRFGFRIRQGVLSPEQGTNATPGEDKTLPSPRDEARSSNKDDDNREPASAKEAPS